MKKTYCIRCEKHKNLRDPQFRTFGVKCRFFLLLVINVIVITKKYKKTENILKYSWLG